MKITYDEYIATWQAPEAKENLDNRIANDSEKRYNARLSGAGQNVESKTKLANMSKMEYESLREYQIVQLFTAYKSSYNANNHGLLGIDTNTTNPNDIRRVVGDRPGYIYNNDILALDNDTIVAVNQLASISGSDYNFNEDKKWTQSLTYGNIGKIVDEMVSCKNILAENMNLDYNDAIGSKIFRQTNIAKRAIGKVQSRSNNQLENDFDTSQVGKNVFGIKDYELSWNKLMLRNSKFWAKTGTKLFNFLDRKIHPNADRNDPDRLGNRTVEVPDEYTK